MIIYFIYQEEKMNSNEVHGAHGLKNHYQSNTTSNEFQLLKHGYDSPTKFDVEIMGLNGGLFIQRDEMVQALKSINIPQYNDESIETFFNGNWIFARGRSSIFQIQLTFKNINSMALYQSCLTEMNGNKGKYPSEQYFTIKVTYTGTYANDEHKTIIFKKCIMSNLSDLSFDHSAANSTMDFSVGFKSNGMEIS
jgi:hypothetical protein